MVALRSLVRIFFLVVFLSAALRAQDGLSDAAARACTYPDFSSSLFGSSLVTADFNNDEQPDAAVLVRASNTFRIEVHLGLRHVTQLNFVSSLSNLAISAFDINHDGTTDLVVEEPFSRQRLFVWLNDGSGSFHAARLNNFPSSSSKQNHSFISAPPRQGCLFLAVPGKLKLRHSPVSAFPLQDSANLAPISSLRASSGAAFPASPNLLRGPPSLPAL